MNLVERVKNILLSPKTEWEVVKGESTTQKELVVGYVLPLAAVAAIAGFLGTLFFIGLLGMMGIAFAFVGMILRVVMAVVSVFVVAHVIDALAPNFGASKNINQAFKVAAYSFTASFVGGIFGIIPFIGWLLGLLVALYGLYLLYLGLMQVMGSPEDKAIGYTAVVVIITIVVLVVANLIVGLVTAGGMMGGALMHGGMRASVQDSAYPRGEAISKLDDFAKKMEAAGKKMEAAQKSGDSNAQAQAALEAMGTAFSGGRKVEPLTVEEVKSFVPESFAGLPRTSQSAERSGVATLMVTTAKATYGGNDKQVRLEVTDAGGAGAMMGLASWMGAMNMEKEDDYGAERTRKEGGRLVHERVSKKGGDNEYSVVVGDRFIVKAVGSGVDLGGLKNGVGAINLAKLEAMKDSGVAKN